MYKYIVALLFSCFILSCKGKKDADKTSDSAKTEKEKKVSKRDESITTANSYSDVFLDSMQLMDYLQKNQVNDTIWRRMISFYNTRNYQYAWFTANGLTEQARGFWNLHQYSTTYGVDTSIKDKSLEKIMNGLIAEDAVTVSNGNKQLLNTELKLTEHFISYLLNNYEDGFIKRKEMERFIPRKKEDPLQLADSLVNKKHKDEKYYGDVNPPYKSLKAQLANYLIIAKKGGWPSIPASVTKLKPGDSSNEVLLLKQRLWLTSDLRVPDSTKFFSPELSNAINTFQLRHGYTPTGKLTETQVADMNVPVVKRIQQILINMGRMQWMINQPKGQLMIVNIPEFILHVKEGDKEAFNMNVVVGKEGHNTMIFTGNMSQVVFSPYWNVPPDIVTKEILPSIAKNPNYLASQNMEIVNNNGPVPVIRQLPGEKNSLGKVKFLFPNSFNIYFHDTPAKTLFSRDKRAFSHGCIRLSDPVKMAEYVLRGTKWTPEKISEAMNSGNEQFVKLEKPIPVLITYYTSWVDEAGLLHFADDIYDHDKAIAERMFTIPY